MADLRLTDAEFQYSAGYLPYLMFCLVPACAATGDGSDRRAGHRFLDHLHSAMHAHAAYFAFPAASAPRKLLNS